MTVAVTAVTEASAVALDTLTNVIYGASGGETKALSYAVLLLLLLQWQ